MFYFRRSTLRLTCSPSSPCFPTILAGLPSSSPGCSPLFFFMLLCSLPRKQKERENHLLRMGISPRNSTEKQVLFVESALFQLKKMQIQAPKSKKSKKGIHLPFVATFHNIWRMKILHGLKYGTKEFKMRDHRRVEKILAEAGRFVHAESIYEAGPQAVTQVSTFCRTHVPKNCFCHPGLMFVKSSGA